MATILVVEDDPLIGRAMAQNICDELGADAVLAITVAGAIGQLEIGPIDFALLDINLRGETTYELARLLESKGIPFAFLSGSVRADVPDDLTSALFLSKPCRARDIAKAVRAQTLRAEQRWEPR